MSEHFELLNLISLPAVLVDDKLKILYMNDLLAQFFPKLKARAVLSDIYRSNL